MDLKVVIKYMKKLKKDRNNACHFYDRKNGNGACFDKHILND